jgi:hypothetical protein
MFFPELIVLDKCDDSFGLADHLSGILPMAIFSCQLIFVSSLFNISI